MNPWFVLWAARLCGLGQKRRRLLFLLSVGLNLCLIGYIFAKMPVVPIRPLCRDGNPVDIDTPWRAVEGRLAIPYFQAFEQRFPVRMVRYSAEGRRIYATVWQSLDWHDIEKQSDLSVRDLLRQRLGDAGYKDWHAGRIVVPGLDHRGASCEAMYKFALMGGEWSTNGPEPAPAR